MAENAKRPSLEPYKGVRDFYPEDMARENYIFATMRSTAERFGFEEYGASILEPTELYASKSSDEIVSEQTYTFEDRGGRSVTLRPEMTPTVARMVAAKRRELAFPLRWYSIPNVFRYERPQRGRLREHWQLNCDIFGAPGISAEAEIILLTAEIMKAFGATEKDFEIHLNNRAVLPETLRTFVREGGADLTDEEIAQVMRLVDRKDKMAAEEYAAAMQDIIGTRAEAVLAGYNPERAREVMESLESFKEFTMLEELLKNEFGLTNIVHDTHLVRGFDYYTGLIFEVFDTNPDNRRSLFGGGRYDHLVDKFGVDPVPAVGFGMGDVTMNDFLETHGLAPAYIPSTQLYLCVASPAHTAVAQNLAQRLRSQDIAVSVDFSNKKIGDQIKTADKKKIPFAMVIGDEEVSSGNYKIKELATGTEIGVSEEGISDFIFEHGIE